MKLRTQCYLPEPSREPAHILVGLRDLRKGLDCVLLGYLLSLGAILICGGVIWALLAQAEGAPLAGIALKQSSTLLLAVAILLVVAGLGSLTLIVRGKWLCLSSAPERFHAKWMMFLSILCILAGPLLNAGGYLVSESNPNAGSRANQTPSLVRLQRELEAYKDGMPELDTRAYIQLAGKGLGLLSGVFFVLFLRAVALCWGASLRARLAELYLLFVVLLVCGFFVLIRYPDYMLARPRLLISLGAGWLFAGMWYFGLILSMSACISTIQARPPLPSESVPSAPPTSSLPPLPEMMN